MSVPSRISFRTLAAGLVLLLALAASADDAPRARFSHIDVFIDPQGAALAAYQLELRATGDVKLVGIEGGEHKAFSHPPYYDPQALLNERIVIAAFNTGDDLPAKKTRVARLMVRIADGAEPKYETTLQVAASADAKPIAGAAISVSEGVSR